MRINLEGEPDDERPSVVVELLETTAKGSARTETAPDHATDHEGGLRRGPCYAVWKDAAAPSSWIEGGEIRAVKQLDSHARRPEQLDMVRHLHGSLVGRVMAEVGGDLIGHADEVAPGHGLLASSRHRNLDVGGKRRHGELLGGEGRG